jgi:hypothetical protein
MSDFVRCNIAKFAAPILIFRDCATFPVEFAAFTVFVHMSPQRKNNYCKQYAIQNKSDSIANSIEKVIPGNRAPQEQCKARPNQQNH